MEKDLYSEVGRNLGLRHNFKGSYDSDSIGKRKKKKKEIALAPLWIMVIQNKLLPNFGVYDEAALRMALLEKLGVIGMLKSPIGSLKDSRATNISI